MRFSMAVSGVQEAMSIKYNTMVYELLRQGKRVIIMSLGEAYFDIPLWHMDDLKYPELYHYSHSRGIPELRELLAGYFKSQYQVAFDPARHILITAGSKAAIHMTLMALLDPGDEVLIPEPAWVSYTEQVRLCHATPVGIPLGTPLEKYQGYVTPRTRVLIINNPHNPTGYVYSAQELQALLDFAKRHNLTLLSDEAYSDFLVDDSFVSIGKLDPERKHSAIFNSISKNYGISGWRIGYVIGNEEMIYQVLKVNQHLITCPATILEFYVARHFHEILKITKPQIHDVVRRRNHLVNYMKQLGMTALPGSATFYTFVNIDPSRLSSEQFCTRLLQEKQVSAVPGLGYGKSCDRYIRVSVGTASTADNEFGARCIREVIDASR